MSTHNSKDRASLCSFTFADGRRCRTPRKSGHPHFCFSHARKEDQAQVAEQLARDISFFFSGKYLSACDLNSALGRLFAAVAQGHLKPKTASTLAYLAQTMVQNIQIAQHEYINAFSTNSWRACVESSINGNQNYRFPKPPQPAAQASAPPPDTTDAATADSLESPNQAASHPADQTTILAIHVGHATQQCHPEANR